MERKVRISEVITYVSKDGQEFSDRKECMQYEEYITINNLHKKLLLLNFHHRFSIQPFFHNIEINNISCQYPQENLKSDMSYLLMRGRVGNGDDRVRYKKRGEKIILLRYSTDSDQVIYLGHIPYFWVNTDLLESYVNDYFLRRNAKFEEEQKKIEEEKKRVNKTYTYTEVLNMLQTLHCLELRNKGITMDDFNEFLAKNL